METNKLDSPFNWQYIDVVIFPPESNTNNTEIKEDLNLLFNDNIDHLKLKDILRTSIRESNQTVRKFLWKRILFNNNDNYSLTILKYDEKINKMFGKNLDVKADLPSFVDKNYLLYYYLNDNGKLAVKRILCILHSVHPEITYSPTLLPLVSLFLHYMTESESYAAILSVVESGNKITQTDIHWNTACQVFRRLAKKYCKSSYEYVLHAIFKYSNNLEKSTQVINEWFWWIFKYLPFDFLLNIIDSYLLEGKKVLYRYGIAILDNFVKYFVRKPPQLDFNCINQFCRQMPIKIERLIKTAFSLRNMSRKEMQELFDTEEMNIKRLRVKAAANDLIASRNSNIGDNSSENSKKYKESISSIDVATTTIKTTTITTTTNKSRFNFQNKKNSWKNPFKTIKSYNNGSKYLNKHVSSYRNHSNHSHQQLLANLPTFSVENIGSKILEPEEIVQIWRWLPTRWQILELETVYSTDIHGCRLMTLFDKTEFYQATIIVIKTTNGSMFGAFCSQPWSNRLSSSSTSTYKYFKPTYFGTGETFLFQLRPVMVKYEWVGKTIQGETDKTQELFLYADNKTLIVGSGGDGNGLLIDENLQYGLTNKCNTFANEPLCNQINFEISVLEVLSFKSSSG